VVSLVPGTLFPVEDPLVLIQQKAGWVPYLMGFVWTGKSLGPSGNLTQTSSWSSSQSHV